MSKQRWAVLGTETGRDWLLIHPDDVYRGSDGLLGCWAVHSRHGTWTEAMQEADRMSRTITVTLPANPHMHASFLGTEMSSDAPDRIKFAGPDGDWSNMIGLEADHIEPFALALLAHARRLA